MNKRKAPKPYSKEFFLSIPFSVKPPGVDHPRFDYFLGEGTAFMKAVTAGTSARSLRKLEHLMEPLSIEIAAWLFSELRLAIAAAERESATIQ